MLSQDEIDKLLSSLGTDGDAGGDALGNSATGLGLLDIPEENFDTRLNDKLSYKLYNFRRPDKFSKDHLRALQTIHESFCRQISLVLTTYLRAGVTMDVVSVDQLTYEEFVRSMPSPMTVAILEMQPLPGQTLLGFGFEVTSAIIDRMLGGKGGSDQRPRELTDIEQALIKRVVERTLTSLEEAWQSMMDVQIFMVGMEENYSMIQVVTPGEIVALVTFEIKIANKDSGLISLCIPYPVVEETIDQLSAQRIFRGQQMESTAQDQERLLNKLHYAKVPVQVHLAGTKVRVNDLLALQVGDVLRLDRRAEEPLLMSINNKPKFFCRPGTFRNHMAVTITDDVDIVESVEGFGLNKIKK
ncbi:MAG: flagellar motor switch protein FliM [Vampirovibrionales bacterium]